MNPFTIQCTTCDARLNVRKRSALGKIFACPSCGGMVLAEPESTTNVRSDAAEGETRRASRWREAKVSAKPAAVLLDSSYEVVNDILDHPPVSDADLGHIVVPSPDVGGASDGAADAVGGENPAPPAASHGAPATEAPAAEAGAVNASAPRTRPARTKHTKPSRYVASTLIGSILALGAFRYLHSVSDFRGNGIANAEVVALKPISSDATTLNREIDARLRRPLGGLPSSASLPAFLHLASHGSDVPIALDVDSLRYSRIDLNTRVTVRDPNEPLGVVLRHSLRPLRLAAESQDGVVWVTSTASPEKSDHRRAQHDVRDLVTSESSAEQLGALVRDFVRPGTWAAQGGSGTMRIVGDIFTIDHAQRVHLDVFAFCDEIRRARGLPVRGKRSGYIDAETISPRAMQTLASRVDVHCLKPTRLAHALAQIEKVAGCHLLVDWQALQREGRSFEDRVIITCEATPLSEVLTRITDQLQLTFRLVGPNAIEITSQEAEKESEMVVFHPLVGGERTMELVLAEMDEWGIPPGPGRRFAYEPVSATLAARLPWSLQRRLADFVH